MEYEYNEPVKRGHGGLAIAFGLLGLALAILVGGFFGMFGIVPAVILAVLAIVLGIGAIRATGGRSGKGGLIIGIITLLITLLVGGMTVTLVSFLRSDDMKKYVPTLSQYADDGWKGFGGVFMSMNADNVDYDKLNEEIQAYNERNNAGNAAVTTEAAR